METVECARCHGRIVVNKELYWADVPSVGVLCNACHERWLEGELAETTDPAEVKNDG
jgi:hypothetical protein